LVDNKEKEAEKYSVSPILASSLGLNRIKTRSGPLPQETFFSFKGDKGSGVLGSSNLSRPSASSGDGGSSSNSSSLGSGKKKEGILGQSKLRVFQESGNGGDNSDSMSTGSGGQSREVSPNLQARTRLQSGESSSEAGKLVTFFSYWL
jgi:hypothetical protein